MPAPRALGLPRTKCSPVKKHRTAPFGSTPATPSAVTGVSERGASVHASSWAKPWPHFSTKKTVAHVYVDRTNTNAMPGTQNPTCKSADNERSELVVVVRAGGRMGNRSRRARCDGEEPLQALVRAGRRQHAQQRALGVDEARALCLRSTRLPRLWSTSCGAHPRIKDR
jgi:hypothetical protein